MKTKSDNKQHSLKTLETQDIVQLTEGVWRHLTGLIENEVKKPNERAVWPRKMSVLLSNGNNQLVAGKVEVRKFGNVQTSSKELGEFYGNEHGFDTIEITEESGQVIKMPLESEPVFYVDFGEEEIIEEAE